MTGVLDGIRVAAFTHFSTGPRLVQFLGAMGAEVVKIESPAGDANRVLVRDPGGRFGGKSPYFATLNRNQRGIVLDLKSEGGHEAARRLVEKADILVENFKPGALTRLGLGYEEVSEANPGLVYCAISGYDPRGPRGKDLGQDMLLQGATGMASLSGRDGMSPTPVGTYAVDAYTAMINLIAILAALRHRDMTGDGQLVHADMMSSGLHMMMEEASFVMNVDPVLHRGRYYSGHSLSLAPYGAFQAKDGAFVLSVATVDQLRTLAVELGLLEEIGQFITVEGQRRNKDEIGAALVRRFAEMSVVEVETAVGKSGIWMGPVRTLAEAMEDPAVHASELIGEHADSTFPPYRYVKEPVALSKSPLRQSRPSPGFGEHTIEVLSELGYSRAEIDEMLESGAALTE